MKKRVISATAIVALMFGMIWAPEAQAQVFLDDESMNSPRARDNDPNLPNVPGLGTTIDQYDDISLYTPLGSGVLALGLLGGAYLIGKKRKED